MTLSRSSWRMSPLIAVHVFPSDVNRRCNCREPSRVLTNIIVCPSFSQLGNIISWNMYQGNTQSLISARSTDIKLISVEAIFNNATRTGNFISSNTFRTLYFDSTLGTTTLYCFITSSDSSSFGTRTWKAADVWLSDTVLKHMHFLCFDEQQASKQIHNCTWIHPSSH